MTPAFLLTTFKNTLIYKNENLYILEDIAPVYYGVTWSDTHLYLLRRNNQLGEVLAIYDKSLEVVREIAFGEQFDSHQIVWFEDKLFLTKTTTNQIVIIDTSKILNKRSKLKIEYLDVGTERADVNHVNALSVDATEREFTVCLSNLGREESEWYVYDIDTRVLKRTYSKCSAGHNLVDGFYTSSSDGLLYTPTDSFYYGSWLRGLSISNELILTSMSVVTERANRGQEFPGRVLVLNDKGSIVQECIKVHGVGQINEVKFLSEGHSFWDDVNIEKLPTYQQPTIGTDYMIRKLEIGSGHRPLPGYEHLDNDPKCPDLDFCTSMDKIPVADNTFNEIKSIHSIEHIGWRKGKTTLEEWYRILAPGGVIHIATPNLRWIMQAYLENGKDWVNDFKRMHADEQKQLMAKGSYSHTLWANFKIFSSGSGDDLHMACYDAHLLTTLLLEVGFVDVKVLHDGDSLIVEAVKN